MAKELEALQDEFKVLKNEVRQTLTDIREYLLTKVENPFPAEPVQGSPFSDTPRTRETSSHSQEALGGAVQQAGPSQSPTPAYQPPPQAQAPMPPAMPWPSAPPVSPPTPQWGPMMPFVLPGPMQQHLPPEIATESAKAADRTPAGHNGHVAGSEANNTSVSAEKQQPEKENRSGGTPAMDATAEQDAPVEQMETATPIEQDIDLLTLAVLTPWVESSVQRLGRRRLQALLDMYADMGKVPSSLKLTLVHLIQLADGDGEPENVSLRECELILLDLEDTLVRSRDARSGSAVLYAYLKEHRNITHPKRRNGA